MRLIDADALIDELNSRIEAAIKWGVNAIADRDAEIKLRAEQAVATFCEASLTAKKMPTIDPAKKGKWIKLDGSLWNMANCSECGEMCVLGDTAKFCPFCGASMVGVITEKRGRREMSDLISRQDAIDALEWKWAGKAAIDAIKNLPSAQKNGDIDEAVEYIKNAQEYLRDIGETWCADYLSDAIDLLVGKRGEDGRH